MSIIRLSLLEDGLYAPDTRGVISYAGPFSRARGAGRRGLGHIGKIVRDSLPNTEHPLCHYLKRAIEIEDANAPEDTSSAPLVVLVHGFQFDPARAYFSPPHHPKADNPHCRLYHFEEHDQDIEMRYHSTGWPRGLGMELGDGGTKGLAVGFGWDSDPSFWEHGLNHYSVAYNRAEVAAWHLVAILDQLVTILPGRPLHLLCHSLGSRIVIRAIALAADRDASAELMPRLHAVIAALDRVILLAGAERVMEAQLMMRRLNYGLRETGERAKALFPKVPSFYNIVSRENDVLDKLAENLGPAAPGSKQVVGHNGLEALDPNWIDIQLDDSRVADWFLKKGYRVTGDNTSGLFTVLDHWIHYTWRDNMRVYHDILRDRAKWEISSLKTEKQDGKRIFDNLRIRSGSGVRSVDERD